MKENRTVSFAQEVKEEMCLTERSDEEKRSLLAAFVRINGHIRLSKGKESLELNSESAHIAKLMYRFLHELYGVSVRFAYTRSAGFLRRVVYHVIIESEASDILSDLEIDPLEGKIPKNSVANVDLSSAYVAGAFLAAGSVNDPLSSNYHLEIALADSNYAKWLSKTLNKIQSHQFESKITSRRNQYIVYLKKSDQISDFLVVVGAPESCLKFENVRVGRDFVNVGNRLQNLDAANMGKTLKASERQRLEINYFVAKLGWERIDNPKLKALMSLRLTHEDATLEELATLLSEQLACEISKSNINHLFRYLDEEYKRATHERRQS
jgi:cell division protein WhiA